MNSTHYVVHVRVERVDLSEPEVDRYNKTQVKAGTRTVEEVTNITFKGTAPAKVKRQVQDLLEVAFGGELTRNEVAK